MILACGKVIFRSDAVKALEASLLAYVKECRKSDGCHRFSMAIEDKSTGEVAVCEIWESDEAMAEHLKKPFVKDFIAKFGPAITTADLQRYDISTARAAPSA